MRKPRRKHPSPSRGDTAISRAAVERTTESAAVQTAPEHRRRTGADRPASGRGMMLPPPPVETGGEPVARRTAVPVLLIALLGGLLYLGDLYLMANSGTFNPLVFYPYHSTNQLADLHPKSEAQLAYEKGRRIYRANCAACHQETGLGVSGQFPPLAGSDWVLVEGPNRLVRIVLNGISGPITVNGQGFNNVMVPWRDTLKDDDIAAVLTYIRSEWGNKAPEVKPEQVKKIRDATQGKAGSWTADELLALPDKD